MRSVKKALGIVRRGMYGKHDDILYWDWLNKSSELATVSEVGWRPLISIVVPTYNTNIVFFDEMVGSVLRQTYENWELLLIDDNSRDEQIRDRIKYYARLDRRIGYRFLHTNHHIAGATNAGITMAKGDFVGLLDHDDVLQPHALREVVTALNVNKKLEFVYTDEDKIIGTHRTQPFLKPDLNIDLLHSVNYITHFAVIKKSTLDKIGYEQEEYNGAQDWELFMRLVRSVPPQNIYHISQVLYSWRVHELSTSKDMGVKPYVMAAQKKAIEDDLTARGAASYTLTLDPKYSGQWRLTYSLKHEVSILVIGNLRDITEAELNTYKFIAVVRGKVTAKAKAIARKLAGEASQADTGLVVNCFNTTIRNNLAHLIGAEYINLVRHFTHVSISKHIYQTTRYCLPEVIDYSVVVVEANKLKILGCEIGDVRALGRVLSAKGFKHLYVPYPGYNNGI